jgi:hypothetical protein
MHPEIRIEQDEDSIADSCLETNYFRILSVGWRSKSCRPALKLGCYQGPSFDRRVIEADEIEKKSGPVAC